MQCERPEPGRRLFCVEYPGRVDNVSRMLKTMGGLDTLGIVYGTKNRRVELRFRPDDVYSKPACGDRHSTVGLLLKVTVKKKARDPDMPCTSRDSDRLHSVTFLTSLVGIVDTVYRFDNLCDFQYLAMEGGEDGSEGACGVLQDIHERLLPADRLPSARWLREDDAPYFLTPPVFSRFDTVHFYGAASARPLPEPAAGRVRSRDQPNTIGRTRKRRQGYAVFVGYSDVSAPVRPRPEALRQLRLKFLTEQQLSQLRRLFEQRPVWSKSALLHRAPFSRDQLKHLLPAVAYYFVTGPWRVMWCRYGYDPRREPAARIYQTFDYRVRMVAGLKSKVRAKRSYSNYLLPYKSSPSSRPKVVIISRHSVARAFTEARHYSPASSAGVDTPQPTPVPAESTCVFRPGYVPPTRQMFYQYCDVLVPEIQAMLRDLPLPPPDSCHPTRGFLPPGFDARCREIVNSLVQAELRKQLPKRARRQELHEREPEHAVHPEHDAHPEQHEQEDNSDVEEILDSDLEDSLYNS